MNIRIYQIDSVKDSKKIKFESLDSTIKYAEKVDPKIYSQDDIIEQISLLISILEKDDNLLTNFDEDIFESMVEKIIVKSQTELEFQLIGGLKFIEKL